MEVQELIERALKISDTLPKECQEKIDCRIEEIQTEEMTLCDLRKAMDFTQVRITELLNMSQYNVSKLEKRTDMFLSTFKSYVTAMGGHIRLIVEFPGRPQMELKSLKEISTKLHQK